MPRRLAIVGTAVLLAGGLAACGNHTGVAGSSSPPSATPAAVRPPTTLLFPNKPAKVMQLAAGQGHVVVTRPTRTGSDLIDVTTPGKPRTLGSFPGTTSTPSIGTDAGGRPVAVLSPCLSRLGLPRCSLVAIDLQSRARSVIPKSRFAYVGDLDAGRAVIARYAADHRAVRVALGVAPGSDAYTSLPIPGSSAARIGSIDLRGDVVATSVFFGDASDYGGSTLLRHAEGSTGWRKLAGSSYGLMNGDRREWRAVTVTASGVRAVYDGGANDDPYAARWDASGKRAKKVRLPGRFDIAYSAFDGDDLISVNNGDFGFDDRPERYGVLRSGPYRLG